jgi:hypothetical protein
MIGEPGGPAEAERAVDQHLVAARPTAPDGRPSTIGYIAKAMLVLVQFEHKIIS